jgi:Restriction endonuclease
MPKTSKDRGTEANETAPVISNELPAYLDVAPSGVSSPLAITLKQTLPLGQLQWKDFERLCVRLIRREGSIVQCRLYGTEGQHQKGIDIFARTDSGDVCVYQCKKVTMRSIPSEN